MEEILVEEDDVREVETCCDNKEPEANAVESDLFTDESVGSKSYNFRDKYYQNQDCFQNKSHEKVYTCEYCNKEFNKAYK